MITLGILVGNRGFFPAHLCDTGCKEISATLKKVGFGVVMLTTTARKFGAAESTQDARKCSEPLEQSADRSDGPFVTSPISAMDGAQPIAGIEPALETVVQRLRRTGLQKSKTGSVLSLPPRKEEIMKEARRIEESALHRARKHFAAAAFWRRLHLCLGLPATALAAIAAASAFSQFDTNHSLAGWISVAVAALSGLATFLNPNEKAACYFAAANNYDALRSKTRIFWSVDCGETNSDQALGSRLKDLSEELNEVNRIGPQPPSLSFGVGNRCVAGRFS